MIDYYVENVSNILKGLKAKHSVNSLEVCCILETLLFLLKKETPAVPASLSFLIPPSKKIPEAVEDEIINLKDFCSSQAIKGSVLLHPDNINWILTKFPEHFEQCFVRRTKPRLFKKNLLLDKLRTCGVSSPILKMFFQMKGLEELKRNG